MISFTTWLDRQTHRDDAVGELATNRLWDTASPPAVTVRDVRRRMREAQALRRFFVALEVAAEEYRANVPSNVVPFTRTWQGKKIGMGS